MGRKRQNIVAISNNVLDFDYSLFSVNECRLWFAVLAQVRDRNLDVIEMTISEFAELAGLSNHHPSYVAKIAIGMIKKIQTITAIERWNFGELQVVWFLQSFGINPTEGIVRFAVSSEYKKCVNTLMRGFTRFELMNFTPLPTRACQELFLQIKQNEYKGTIFIPIDLLRQRLGLSAYRANDITKKVVVPAVKKLNELMVLSKEISCETVIEKRKIIGYKIYLDKDFIDEDEPW